MRIWETRLREYSGRISVRLEILPFYLRESSKSLLCSIALDFFRRAMGVEAETQLAPKLEWDSSLQITIFMLRHRSAAASENEPPLSFHALLCLYRISRIFPERTAPKNPAYFSEKLIQEHSKVGDRILSMHILYACAGSQLGHLNPKALQGRKKSLGLSAWSGRIGAAFTSLTSLIGQKQELVQLGFHPLV